MENIVTVHSRTREMKIGKITYIVSTHYNENSVETAEDKFLRLVADRISEELKKPINSMN